MDKRFTLYNDDCLNALKAMEDNSIDSCVTDPPYGLSSSKGNSKGGFMGLAWDYDVPQKDIWEEVFRVLKPGGHLLAFFGSRTYHRGVVQIEDAGFEIRDQIMWLYGSGFPKSHNIGDGWGTALKPAHEPIVVARKTISQSVAKNVLEYGTGALNIDGCRVGNEERFNPPAGNKKGGNSLNMSKTGMPQDADGTTALGRWPANVIHDGSDEVVSGFPDSNGSGPSRTLKRNAKPQQEGWGMNKTNADEVLLPDGGSGSAARFFYCAKASKSDRDEGNNHPTVKPTNLMSYLVRLVTPPNGTVLDPFMGSGTTGKAAMIEGFNFVGIERDKDYFEIAEARIEAALNNTTPNLESFFT